MKSLKFLSFLALHTFYLQGKHWVSCSINQSVDLMVLLDVTSGMKSIVETARSQISSFFLSLQKEHPESRMGVVTFNSKPNVCRFVTPTNYCARFLFPLSSNSTFISNRAIRLHCTGNNSVKKTDVLGAILVAALEDESQWVFEAENTTTARRRIIAVITNSGYAKRKHYKLCGTGLVSSKEPSKQYEQNNGDANYRCSMEDFPSSKQVANVLKRLNIFLLFLVSSNRVHLYDFLLNSTQTLGDVTPFANNSGNHLESLLPCIEKIIRSPSSRLNQQHQLASGKKVTEYSESHTQTIQSYQTSVEQKTLEALTNKHVNTSKLSTTSTDSGSKKQVFYIQNAFFGLLGAGLIVLTVFGVLANRLRRQYKNKTAIDSDEKKDLLGETGIPLKVTEDVFG